MHFSPILQTIELFLTNSNMAEVKEPIGSEGVGPDDFDDRMGIERPLSPKGEDYLRQMILMQAQAAQGNKVTEGDGCHGEPVIEL